MNSLPAVKDFKPKSFWEKREGNAGIILAAAGIVGGAALIFKFLDIILPFINRVLDNLLHTILVGGAIFIIIYVVFIDKRTRNLLWYMYKSLCRAITSIFVSVDPIGIIQTHMEKAKKHLENVRIQTSRVRGGIEELHRELKKNANQILQNRSLIKAAQNSGEERYLKNAKLAARQTGRLDKQQATYKELLQKMEALYRTLNRVEEAADFLIKDTEDEIKQKKKEREIVSRGHSAIRSAMKLIRPEDDEVHMFNMAMEYMEADIANKVGDIEHAIEVSQSFLDGVDLQNAQFEGDGWALIEKWEKEESPLLGAEKKKAIEQSYDDKQVLNTHIPMEKKNAAMYVPVNKPKNSEFGKYF